MEAINEKVRPAEKGENFFFREGEKFLIEMNQCKSCLFAKIPSKVCGARAQFFAAVQQCLYQTLPVLSYGFLMSMRIDISGAPKHFLTSIS